MVQEKTTVLIVGGGPGGSYAASVLAREDIDVALLEADRFPRYHVGESQLASLRHFLRFIDLEKQFEEHGFMKKVGAAFKLNQHKREGYTDFISEDKNNYSWNLIRSESDDVMLRHAGRCGAIIHEETRVTDIEFSDSSVPIAARWKNKAGDTGRIMFDQLIDASGRAGILSVKYLHNRQFTDGLKNVAFWGYWTGCGDYMPGTLRAGSPYFEALTDESGWAFFIPLHDGTTSVGIVMNQLISDRKRLERKERGEENTVLAHYHASLQLAPAVTKLMTGATLVTREGGSIIRSASDYSYSAPSYAGPHYRIIGDAGAFLDPYFSSGVHLALSGGLSAAATICATLRGECSELQAIKWHTTRVQTSYNRFLLVVLSAYQQIRSQSAPILTTETDDNFDDAFEHFRPIIQGTLEAGSNITQEQLRTTIDFCNRYAFEPSQPEDRAKVNESLMFNGTSLSPDLENVRKAMVARKLLRTEETIHIDNFVSDSLAGFRLRLQRGALGLDKDV